MPPKARRGTSTTGAAGGSASGANARQPSAGVGGENLSESKCVRSEEALEVARGRAHSLSVFLSVSVSLPPPPHSHSLSFSLPSVFISQMCRLYLCLVSLFHCFRSLFFFVPIHLSPFSLLFLSFLPLFSFPSPLYFRQFPSTQSYLSLLTCFICFMM